MKPLTDYSESELYAELDRRAKKAPKWVLWIPAQWVESIQGSSKAVVAGVAKQVLRGPFTYEVKERKAECFCGAPSCDICHGP
jgi:hypothetical protein